MKFLKTLIITGIFMTILAGCMSSPGTFTEKTIILEAKQTIKVAELDMTITNAGCGRKWMVDNGGERPYCDLEVKMQDSVYHFGDSFEPLYIKNLELKIEKMNPWGREEDSVPPGGCRIVIKRLPDLSR